MGDLQSKASQYQSQSIPEKERVEVKGFDFESY
jgi:hypothetical protein